MQSNTKKMQLYNDYKNHESKMYLRLKKKVKIDNINQIKELLSNIILNFLKNILKISYLMYNTINNY